MVLAAALTAFASGRVALVEVRSLGEERVQALGRDGTVRLEVEASEIAPVVQLEVTVEVDGLCESDLWSGCEIELLASSPWADDVWVDGLLLGPHPQLLQGALSPHAPVTFGVRLPSRRLESLPIVLQARRRAEILRSRPRAVQTLPISNPSRTLELGSPPRLIQRKIR